MSVLIKGMEMPKSKGEYTLRVYVHFDGTATVEGAYCRFEGEPFVAVPVPPHGRLIDADALDIKRREEQAWHDYERNPDNEYLEGVKDGLHEAAKQLSIAPTIIPASEEGET